MCFALNLCPCRLAHLLYSINKSVDACFHLQRAVMSFSGRGLSLTSCALAVLAVIVMAMGMDSMPFANDNKTLKVSCTVVDNLKI